MSANLATLPGPASAPAQIVSNASAAKESGDPKTPGSSTESTPFANVFKQMMGKQKTTEEASNSINIQEDTAPTLNQQDPLTDLTALMPFLEALGFAKAAEGKDEHSESLELVTSDGVLLASLSGIQAQAETAISAAAVQGETVAATLTSEVKPPIGSVTQDISKLVNVAPELVSVQPELVDATAEHVDVAPELAKMELETVGMTSTDITKELKGTGSESKFEQLLNQNSPLAASAASTGQGSASATPATRIPVDTPVGHTGWSEDIGNRVVWMSNRMENRAELVLTPPQMGRIEVSLTITGDQATASFISGNPNVREALESALPRLREILAEAGIQLGQAQVGAENTRQPAQQERRPDQRQLDHDGENSGQALALPAEIATGSRGLKIGRGLVDVFA